MCCMASSAIVCVGDELYRDVSRRFVEASKDVRVADPLDPRVADEAIAAGRAAGRAFLSGRS